MSSALTKILRFSKVIRGKDFYSVPDINIAKQTLGNEGANFTIACNEINKDTVVYSFGVGTDISFDLALINKYGVSVYAFDPTPKSLAWVKSQNPPSSFKMHDCGLANYDGTATFNPPENPDHVSHTLLDKPQTSERSITVAVKRLITIMNELGHDHIDVLKMDIEGAEYDVIEDILNSKINIKQILIEFHHRFPNVGVEKTKKSLAQLKKAGYRIFDVSATGEEFSFIKM